MRNRYRIVRDAFAGFEVQIKRWWFPFWVECWTLDRPVNSHRTHEQALEFIVQHSEGR